MLDYPCRRLPITLVTMVLAGLVGCNSFNNASTAAVSVVKPYKIDVVQGNVVTREQLAVLRPGMPRTMVRDVLGTALLSSVFHSDRWDYVFTLKRQGAEPQSRRVTVYFKNELVERIDADELPSEVEFVATLRTPPITGPLPELEASAKSLEKFPVDPAQAAPTSAPVPAQVTYPPLEPSQQ